MGKALVLLSGGLDSRLALIIMKELLGESNVEAVYFILPFEEYSNRKEDVIGFSKEQKVKLHIINCVEGTLLKEYMDIIRNPQFGRGAGLNPCIDCHIFMLQKAKKLARKIKADIIVTGEVVGERPMSQREDILYLIEKQAKLQGKILRPLSAKLLPPTEAENKGLIDRNKLESIRGRQRKRQMELAEKFRISYPNPAGGCSLCYPDFCKKVTPVLKSRKNITAFDIALFTIGRHFENGNIILGKNEKENEALEYTAKKHRKGIIITPDQPGPSALIKSKKYEREAKELIRRHSKHTITGFQLISHRLSKGPY